MSGHIDLRSFSFSFSIFLLEIFYVHIIQNTFKYMYMYNEI